MGFKAQPYAATAFIERNQYVPGETMRFKVNIDNTTCHKDVEYLKVCVDRVFLIKGHYPGGAFPDWNHKAKGRVSICEQEFKKPCTKENKVELNCELTLPTFDM